MPGRGKAIARPSRTKAPARGGVTTSTIVLDAALSMCLAADACFWPKADVQRALSDDRFWPLPDIHQTDHDENFGFRAPSPGGGYSLFATGISLFCRNISLFRGMGISTVSHGLRMNFARLLPTKTAKNFRIPCSFPRNSELLGDRFASDCLHSHFLPDTTSPWTPARLAHSARLR